MKPYGIIVPGSVVTAKTAPDYLRRMVAYVYQDLTVASSLFLADVEQRLVSAGFLTWEQCEAIELQTIQE